MMYCQQIPLVLLVVQVLLLQHPQHQRRPVLLRQVPQQRFSRSPSQLPSKQALQQQRKHLWKVLLQHPCKSRQQQALLRWCEQKLRQGWVVRV
jgi:hypothetical protein